MKKHIFSFLLITSNVLAFSQASIVEGEIQANNGAKLSILNVYPDSFPQVSVVFRAQDTLGNPVWDINKNSLAVAENKITNEIVSVQPISKNKAINISLVIDHSGSMALDFSQLYNKYGQPLFRFDWGGNFIYPKGYVPPIKSAKSAALSFINDFDFSKDYINVVGFSSSVDVNLPLSNNKEEISKTINNLKADSSTAFFDALQVGINELDKAEGIKILIALTDGNDNSSSSKWNDVVHAADSLKIPVYTVGLGDVNQDSLKMMSEATNGSYFYAKNSSTLSDIYKSISEQIQAYYNLVYVSTNLNNTDSNRLVAIQFKLDSNIALSAETTHLFPTELIEFEKEKQFKSQLYTYGGGALTLVGAGILILLVARKKRKKKESDIA